MNPRDTSSVSFTSQDQLAALCRKAQKGATIGKYIVSGVVLLALLALLLQINN